MSVFCSIFFFFHLFYLFFNSFIICSFSIDKATSRNEMKKKLGQLLYLQNLQVKVSWTASLCLKPSGDQNLDTFFFF